MDSHEDKNEKPQFVDDVVRERWRREVGRARVLAAMDHIQQAQVELMLAMQDLCSVIGYDGAGDQVSTLHQSVKRQWYRIQDRFERGPTKSHPHTNELDHVPSADERANAHAGGCGRRAWVPTFMSLPTPLAKDSAK